MENTTVETSSQEVKTYTANVTKIQWYQALTNLSLWMPIWIVFLQTERQLTLTQITAMTGISWLMTALAEVPTGALADTYGHKFSVALGTVLVAIGTCLFGFLPSYWGIMGAFFIWSIGLALQSGADMAILFDSTTLAGKAADYPKIAGHSFAIIQFAQGIASVVGGLLASRYMSLPMLVTSLLSVVGLGVVISIKEPTVTKKVRRNYWASVAQAVRLLRTRRVILYLMLYTSIMSGTAWAVTFVMFQPYMVDRKVYVGLVGILFMALRGAGTLGSMYGHKLMKRVPTFVWLLVLPLLFGSAFALMGLIPGWWVGFVLMLVIGLFQGSFRPLLSALLNERVTSDVRATILSLQSLLFSLYIAGIQPVLGAVTDLWGLLAAFLLLAVVSLVLLLLRGLWLGSEAGGGDSVSTTTEAKGGLA